MGRLTLLYVISAAVTGLTSGSGVLPDFVNATLGGKVTFTTSLPPTNTPLASIIWSFEDIIFLSPGFIDDLYKDRITLFNFTGSLELRNLAFSDAGDYSVTVTQTGVRPEIGRTVLNIYEPVSNVKGRATNTDLVESRDTVTLSCSASGSPESFLWFNGTAKVIASDRVQFTNGGANVTIVTVLRYDQGSYSCEAFNPVSTSTSDEDLHLNVSYGPEGVNMKTPPSNVYLEGSDVPLSCSADSRPEAQIKWLLNGEEMSSYTGTQINLVIKQSGNYSCQALNSKTQKNETSQPAEFRVFKKIENVLVQSSDTTFEGSSVNLTCDASGSIVNREWMFNGINLQPGGNIEFYDEKRVLSFKTLTRKDSGKYTCSISNPASSDSADYPMKVIFGAENVQITGCKSEVQLDATLTLSCKADSEPPAIFTWTLNGTTLVQSHEYVKENVISSDSGEYICQAKNEITNKSPQESCRVTVTAIPPRSSGCSTGCIVGIVFGVIAVILIVAGVLFFVLKKKKQKAKSNTRTDGEGQDNSTNAQNQEVQYADVRFVKKGGVTIPGGAQNQTEYAEVRKNNRAPGSRLPSYDAHMQRGRRPDPEPATLYADIRVK